MKIDIDKDWCLRMAEREDGEEIGAGLLAIDPVFDENDPTPNGKEEE